MGMDIHILEVEVDMGLVVEVDMCLVVEVEMGF